MSDFRSAETQYMMSMLIPQYMMAILAQDHGNVILNHDLETYETNGCLDAMTKFITNVVFRSCLNFILFIAFIVALPLSMITVGSIFL